MTATVRIFCAAVMAFFPVMGMAADTTYIVTDGSHGYGDDFFFSNTGSYRHWPSSDTHAYEQSGHTDNRMSAVKGPDLTGWTSNPDSVKLQMYVNGITGTGDVVWVAAIMRTEIQNPSNSSDHGDAVHRRHVSDSQWIDTTAPSLIGSTASNWSDNEADINSQSYCSTDVNAANQWEYWKLPDTVISMLVQGLLSEPWFLIYDTEGASGENCVFRGRNYFDSTSWPRWVCYSEPPPAAKVLITSGGR